MTNLSHLTDDELIRYLDNTSTDPIVRRLVQIFIENDDMIFRQLVDVGMDRDGRFESDYEHLPVGQYIEYLRNEVDYYQREAEELEYKLDDEKEKSKRLSARSIAEVMSELNEQIRFVNQKAKISEQERDRAVKDRDLAKEQLKMWNHLRDPA